ncbi:class I fructose-bisphosphate aldolase [Maricaulis salignorans]|uniref:Fructose-bisphosphate aldolase n=1 Tax=Maricaulis salignorans TaxID=144026 RepID=A0A1G9W8I6_9PROT|nr:fructose-bisphosphate aldolase, class I [Maricaulis salignorans]
MDLDQLNETACAMVAPGKGLLAADESTGTIGKRFASIDLENTADNRRDWREMLFRTEPAMSEHVSGVILYDETIRQKSKDGTPLVKLIQDAGAIPGIKVDAGAKGLAGSDGEMITEGLDGLRDRLADYYGLGARFAKWRAVINIGRNGDESMPSQYCINTNMHALARYAALCQEANIVPIVEPEVIMDGDHSIERCYEVTEFALKTLYRELFDQGVILEGTILKPNMVISGTKNEDRASIEEVADMTMQCLANCVPAAVPGIAFLSGGQSDEEATAHLNAMTANYDLPWPVSFSYGRALQAAPLKVWAGKPGNVDAAQAAFNHRARMNSLASLGEYDAAMEKNGA